MQILLERTGGIVSALQGALHNFLSLDSRNGYAQNYLNSLNVFLSASNAVSVDTGILYISGFRVQNNVLFTETIATLPSSPIRMQLIAKLDVKLAAEHSTCDFIVRPIQPLIQDNIFRFGSGIYELELARFTAQMGGIIDVIKTIDALIGIPIGDGSFIIGDVITETLEAGMDAEVDIEQRIDDETGETVTDFSFSLPQGKTGPQGPQGTPGEIPQSELVKIAAAETAASNAAQSAITAQAQAATAQTAATNAAESARLTQEAAEQIIEKGGTAVTTNGVLQAAFETNTKQDTLVSGLNIKTFNNQSLLGAGNIESPSPFKVLWDWRSAGLSTPPTIVANYTIPITLSRGHLYKFYVHNQVQGAFSEIVFDYDHTNTNYSVQTSASGFSRATSLGFGVSSILFNSTFSQITSIYEQLASTTGVTSVVRTNFRLIKIIEVLG